MSFLSERKYSFTSSALPKNTFAVVDFSGEEGLSRTYRFDIGLVTDNADIDLDAVMAGTAKFVIHREGHHDVPFNGILAAFEQQHAVNNYVFYRAVLVPRLWWLSLTHHNQVFLDKTVPDIVGAVLRDGGLTSMDFDFRLQGTYAPQEYVCQYDESHLDFIERWLAREGIYYFFEQVAAGERIVYTDTIIAHKKSRFGSRLSYSLPSGLDTLEATESVQGFVCRQHLLPRRVLLKDYNYRKPSLEMIGTAAVDARGRGERFVYGEHFRTPEEGNRLARIRAQALLCRKREFIGESTAPFVSPGYSFELKDHYRNEFNQQYLTLEMTHSGSQTGYLVSGIQKGLSDRERTVAYRNQFTAIPASDQFRPEPAAVQPKITGTLNAKIDAAGSGKYAELDDQGRYKVILPFDMSGRKDGKASTWLRMIQPYGGSDHGMHFPLHKDTEVLLTFIDGNPDRPVIAGAAPNPETPSPVTGSDQTMAKLTTSGGNQIHIEDREGSERILLNTPKKGSFVRIGAHNDPDETEAKKKEKWKAEGPGTDTSKTGTATEETWGIHLFTHKMLDITAQTKNEIILGEKTDTTIGAEAGFCLGGKLEVQVPSVLSYSTAENHLKAELTEAIEENTRVIGEHTEAIQVHTDLIAENTHLIEENTETIGQNTRLIETHSELIGENSRLIEENTETIGQNTRLIETHTDLIGENSRLIEENTETIAQNTRLIETHTDLIGENSRLIGENSDTIGEHTQTIGEHTKIIGEMLIL